MTASYDVVSMTLQTERLLRCVFVCTLKFPAVCWCSAVTICVDLRVGLYAKIGRRLCTSRRISFCY